MNVVSTALVVVAVLIVVACVIYWYAKKHYGTQLGILEFFANPIESIKGVFT